MATIKAPIFLCEDESNNYYAKLLFFDGEYSSRFIAGSGRSEIIQYFKKQMKKECLENDQDLYLFDNEDVQFHLGKATVKVKPNLLINGKIFPGKDTFTIISWYVFAVHPSGVVEIRFPLEDIRENILIPADSGSKGDKSERPKKLISKSAKEMLQTHYNRMSSASIIMRHPPIRAEIETIQTIISSKDQKKNSSRTFKNQNESLGKIITPITDSMAKRMYDPPYQRDDEIKDLANHIRNLPNSIILCGKSGCGKSSILAAAIRMLIRSGSSGSDDFQGMKFWQTTAQKIKSGTKYVGEWEQQLLEIVEYILRNSGILCVEKIIDLVDNIDNPESSIAGFLTNIFEKTPLRIIGEASPEELIVLQKLLPQFANKFFVFNINEMNPDETEKAINGYLADFFNAHRNFEVDPNVPATTARICSRFIGDRVLPGPAVSFLRKNLQAAILNEKSSFTERDVVQGFVDETGLPEWIFRNDLPLQEQNVFDALTGTIIGQPSACASIMRSILKFKAGLNNPKKPIASFLFCGPTGVGKTQLTKTLAQYLFNNKNIDDREHLNKSANDHLFRLEMSEYQDYYSAVRLTEKPNGSPSALIEHIRKTPFSVILFDEIEKADSSVFDILLSLLDEGRLTDRLGRTTSFRESIIIMTSNLGGKFTIPIGFASEKNRTLIDGIPDLQETENQIISAVEKHFRPEFINRIDEIIVFNPLDQESSRKIADLEIRALEKLEGLASRNIHLKWTDAFVKYLLKKGFDIRYGARPLQRAIENELVRHLGSYLTEHPDLKDTDLYIDMKKGIQITTKES
ncbi:MAG: AAA family ATPase [Planctomycetia bacterium]|nr:AAA family ATPase [Planctomycetia bacterium]